MKLTDGVRRLHAACRQSLSRSAPLLHAHGLLHGERPGGFSASSRVLPHDGNTAIFNFYASALVKSVIPETGKTVAFDMYSLYPRSNAARIVSHTENAGVVPLKLRIPKWSEKTVVKVNGQEQQGVAPGAYFTIEREWKLGDIVEIYFDMPVIAHKLEHNIAFTRSAAFWPATAASAMGDSPAVRQASG